MLVSLALGALSFLIWLGMWLGRSWFWRIEPDLDAPAPAQWPPVTAVIPARDEQPVIGETLRSLWAQGYPGGLRVVLTDDHSEDGTADEARRVAREMGREADLTIVEAEPLPSGWSGKVWAMHQALTRGVGADDPARFVLFSDADISHGPETLRALVSRSEADGLDLSSYMVRLQCRSQAERFMIPAFVFFFRMLYPFRAVNDARNPLAGAAGGTMLVRRTALERIGGMSSIRGELIDDCSLAREIKRGGHPIRLTLAGTSESTRGYQTMGEILKMIARTAYTQLGYSPTQLLGCVFGLGLTFIMPPALTLFGAGWGRWLGAAAWILMTLLYLPMVRFYRQSPFWAPLLPATAAVYLWATILSAWRHHRGVGGQWKGRAQSQGVGSDA